MIENLTVERLDGDRTGEVWRCCRWCNTEIPPSAPHHAYCDVSCKRRAMRREMGET